MITYKPGKGIGYLHPPGLSADEAATLHYAVSAYGFLLNDWGRRNKRITWGEFAALIRQNYAATARTEAILTVIERAELGLVATSSANAKLEVVASVSTVRRRRTRPRALKS